ncbi:ROK family protein [Hyphomonas sp.]|uniref:ROK family protein n=1 Tax=Hyphomonas sp. TaxID=87 RepID=UPI0025B8E725|nr:ROK family protein [Hyphomonas sp.]
MLTENTGVYGGIDAGGTTFKCGLADSSGNLIEKTRVPVSSPAETLAGCAEFFRSAGAGYDLKGLGLASFGPLDVDPGSPDYGMLLKTPKAGWSGAHLRRYFTEALGVDVCVDTDVNGALLAERSLGAAAGTVSAAYITVGTGIGAGIFINGEFAGRPCHPEFGHIPVRRHPRDTRFEGVCPFHGDCLEGVASVSAVRARWGDPEAMSPDHEGWMIVADYLAQACRVLTLTLRLERIIIGGGLSLAPNLIALVRSAYDAQMASYLGENAPSGAQLIDRPLLGDDAGLMGAVLLARNHR